MFVFALKKTFFFLDESLLVHGPDTGPDGWWRFELGEGATTRSNYRKVKTSFIDKIAAPLYIRFHSSSSNCHNNNTITSTYPIL